MPYSMLKGFLERGELKNFQRMEKEGACAQGMIAPGPDATTPPAHAALLCGCGHQGHGIYSFDEPVIETGIIHPWKKRHGFDANRLKAEPLWVSFLKAGKKATLLHFPLSTPIDVFTSKAKFGADFSDRLTVIESFSQRLTPEIVRKNVDSEGTFSLKLSDSSKIPLPLTAPKSAEPAVFKNKQGGLWRMRFAPDQAGEPDLYFLSPFSRVLSNRQDLADQYLDEVGPFAASAAAYSYNKDKLGNRIYRSGSGKAEQRLAQSLDLLGQHFYSAIEFVLEKVKPEVGFYYFNGIDLCLHLWMAYLDPSSPAYSKKIFDSLWPVVKKMFEWTDRILGLLMERSGPEDLLVVVSDHGMAPIEAIFYPNQVLADAGYLVWDYKKKEPDLTQSRAVYQGSNSGYIVLNLKSRGGIAADEDADELAAKVASAFEPQRGTVLDKIELTAEHPEIPPLGEIHLVPKYKITLQEEVEGKVLEKNFYAGQHHYWAESEAMKAVLCFKGPGVPAGCRLGVRNHLEVAKTIALLAGIKPPEKAGFGPIKF